MSGFGSFGHDKNFGGGNLIPAGTLAWALLTIRGVKHSNSTGGKMADYELTISDGPFSTRKLWGFIGDPSDQTNSEGFRTMGLAALQHICEIAGIFDPNKPETYQRYANATFEQICADIDGKRVGIKISVQKGQDGYQDKNQVGAWLSPNPKSGSFKLFERLLKGDTAAPDKSGLQPAQATFGGFGANQQTPPPAVTPQPAAPVANSPPAWLQAGQK